MRFRILPIVAGCMVACFVIALCVPRSFSGDYVANDPNRVMTLELTQRLHQELRGNLTMANRKTDGTINRANIAIVGGVTDGRALTLTLLTDASSSEIHHLHGAVTRRGVDLDFGGALEHFVRSAHGTFEDPAHASIMNMGNP